MENTMVECAGRCGNRLRVEQIIQDRSEDFVRHTRRVLWRHQTSKTRREDRAFKGVYERWVDYLEPSMVKSDRHDCIGCSAEPCHKEGHTCKV